MSFTDVPLIDDLLAGELFQPSGDPETLPMQREIWLGIRGDLFPEIEQVLNESEDTIRPSLHRIAGYVSTAGLRRLAAILREWEKSDFPLNASSTLGPLARQAASESIEAMENRYPHLRPSGV